MEIVICPIFDGEYNFGADLIQKMQMFYFYGVKKDDLK